MYNSNSNYKNLSPCSDYYEIGKRVSGIETGNAHLTRALRHIAINICQKIYCPDEVKVEGELLIIKKCPFHPDLKYDNLIFDPREGKFRCVRSPTLDIKGVIEDIDRKELELWKNGDGVKKIAEVSKSTENEDGEEINISAIPAVITENDTLETLYEKNKEMMEKNFGVNCTVYKNAGMICEPCLIHKDERHDAIFFNLTQSPYWRCVKDMQDIKDIPIYTITDEKVRKSLISKSKIYKTDEHTFNSIIVERKYLLGGLYISIKGGKEGHMLFKYLPDKGYYKTVELATVRDDALALYESIWKQKPPLSLVSEMVSKICEIVERGENLSIFNRDKGNLLYIPMKDKDVEINKVTGEIRALDKDPINRPFLVALSYRFIPDIPEETPEELKEIVKLVPPQFQDLILDEFASPLASEARHIIFVNYSRVSNTGKSTLFRRMWELYNKGENDGEENEGGLLTTTDISLLGDKFERSDYVGKGALLIDEIEDMQKPSRVASYLKKLASGGVIRVEEKYGKKKVIVNRMIVIINTNKLYFPPDSTVTSRLSIIPFIMNFEERKRVPEWSFEQRERIVNWLIVHRVLKYLKEEEKKLLKYDEKTILRWIKEKKGKPPSFVRKFIRDYFYPRYTGKEKHGMLVTFEEAYRYYLLIYAEKTVPVTFKEFVEIIEKIAEKEKAYVVDDNGVKKLYMRKKGLEVFL